MREVDHPTVVDELIDRGYNPDKMWVGDYERGNVNDLDDYLKPNADRTAILDWLSVEGQTTDGLFEDPRSEYDFTRFLTEHDGLVARMLYYMISTQGLDYTYEDLVDDIETLSKEPIYNAPFDRKEALNAR